MQLNQYLTELTTTNLVILLNLSGQQASNPVLQNYQFVVAWYISVVQFNKFQFVIIIIGVSFSIFLQSFSSYSLPFYVS